MVFCVFVFTSIWLLLCDLWIWLLWYEITFYYEVLYKRLAVIINLPLDAQFAIFLPNNPRFINFVASFSDPLTNIACRNWTGKLNKQNGDLICVFLSIQVVSYPFNPKACLYKRWMLHKLIYKPIVWIYLHLISLLHYHD